MDGNLVGEEVRVGDRVHVIQNMNTIRLSASDYHDLTPDMAFEVTRVYSNTLSIRSIETMQVQNQWRGHERKRASFNVDRMLLAHMPENYRPRRIGEKPEDTEDMTYIDKDHPGIQWLWEDLGRYADEQGYCTQYDALTARVGIPGRPRDFSVTLEMNGVRFQATVQARSQREANERAQQAAGLLDKAEVISE